MTRSLVRLLLILFAFATGAETVSAELRAEADAQTVSSSARDWPSATARAERERKPVLVLFRTATCGRCDEFESVTLQHPATLRRITSVPFAVVALDASTSTARELWQSTDPGMAIFDDRGVLLARWPIVPDTMSFAIMLDTVIAIAPHIERASTAREAGRQGESELELALALIKLGFPSQARNALRRAESAGNLSEKQLATIVEALLESGEGRRADALERLKRVTASPADPRVGAEAWIAAGSIHRMSGDRDRAREAFVQAQTIAPAGSAESAAAARALAGLLASAEDDHALIRIVPLPHTVVSGIHVVTTHVTSAAVDSVTFQLDERQLGTDTAPPFSKIVDFGSVPARHVVTVAARDRNGRVIARDQKVINEAGETFTVRITEPRERASGRTQVKLNLRTPAAAKLEQVVLRWNDVERAVLTRPPWTTEVVIPREELGVLSAVVTLADGRTVEDAVLLNGAGASDRADVHLVQLPVTIHGLTNARIEASAIRVMEGTRRREVQSIARASETPLTVGILIDTSRSMQKTLPDVQEAAIRFLERTLMRGDRAFVIAFDSEARLLQSATGDLDRLRRHILRIQPEGRTALYDAIVLGLLQFEGVKGRRALVLFSDGVDQTSRYPAATVQELTRRTSVPLHTIAPIPGMPAAGESGQRASGEQGILDSTDAELQRLTGESGGTFHNLSDLSALEKTFEAIEAALRAQVLLFIRTDPATRDQEWRQIEVNVPGEGIRVFAPRGYYAGW